MKQLIFIGLMLLGTLTYAQSNRPVTVNLTVGGTCDMCKERIERTVDVKGVKYFRVDISKSPEAKKEFRIRMAPTLIIFNQGSKEEVFKAGLDLLCPVTLEELEEALDEIKTADKF